MFVRAALLRKMGTRTRVGEGDEGFAKRLRSFLVLLVGYVHVTLYHMLWH